MKHDGDDDDGYTARPISIIGVTCTVFTLSRMFRLTHSAITYYYELHVLWSDDHMRIIICILI